MAIVRFDQTLHTLFIRTQLSYTAFPLLKRSFVLLVLLLFSLEACSAGISSTTAKPTARPLSPTPTRLPAGTVLYQADWSRGLADWSGAKGWKVVQGQLESDSNGTATFTIPYQLSVTDYAVEVHIQIIRSVPPNGGYFSITAPKTTDKDGYQAGISNLEGSGPRPFGDHPQAQVFLDPYVYSAQGSGIPQDYEPGTGWHTYRVEVRGNEVSFLDNGTQVGYANSQRTDFLSNGPISFNSKLVILRMSALRILAL